MANETLEFESVILCEDVREEVGGKKSVIGALPGDIVVSDFPAVINLALYAVYKRPNLDSEELHFTLMRDEQEVAKMGVSFPSGGTLIGTVILPRGIARFDHESVFTIKVKRGEDGPETTIVSKKILKGDPLAPMPT